MKITKQFAGRQWLVSQEDRNINSALTKIPAILNGRCQRCNSLARGRLPTGTSYCRECLGLGRASSNQYLVRDEQVAHFRHVVGGGLRWQGQLTPPQAQVSQQLQANFKVQRDTLVQAVTGAGKTEMVFGILAAAFEQGKRVAIASPRLDVVNELYLRLQPVFRSIQIGKYHGQMATVVQLDQLVVCTTHQLLKFYHAFDLLIIDEVDAFPYAGNAMLQFAAQQAVKPSGMTTYLTATPPGSLLAQVASGELAVVTLKRRFHGGRLPVPEERLLLRPYIQCGHLHARLLADVLTAQQAGHPLLLFVPRIAEIPIYLAALSQVVELQNYAMAGVFAADPQRLDKITAFRAGKLALLVTTTILERGVTFPHVWVLVVAADDPLYTTASLVQLAGRVGRAADDPTGRVAYYYHRYTQVLRACQATIRGLNQ